MVTYDSLIRHMLPPYGNDWVHAPNFTRLSDRSATFDTCYVGSMPCMPARREMHTGRYNFLHRSWGPLEPFDDSMPEFLKQNGIYTHLISDHYQYWVDGGATYHPRYSSWEMSRGQEAEKWKAIIKDPIIPEDAVGANCHSALWWRHEWGNRQYMQNERDMPQPKTVYMGLDFLKENHCEDNWFLHIETFDPHEPYWSPQRFKDLYEHDFNKIKFDWPPYRQVNEIDEEVKHVRFEYAAVLSMCDEYLGKIMDAMDEYDLWKDTMLIVNTDHGFMLGEHGWWAKCMQPLYNEIAHIPLWIWDPRSKVQGERRKSLVQTIDLPVTLMNFFNLKPTPDMQGHDLAECIAEDSPVRSAGLFGIHGAHVCVTNGKHIYMRASEREDNQPLYEYTLVPMHAHNRFQPREFEGMELTAPFDFTKGCRTMKFPLKKAAGGWRSSHKFGSLLFNVEEDPQQNTTLDDPETERNMIKEMIRLMKENDAPPEQFRRLGLE